MKILVKTAVILACLATPALAQVDYNVNPYGGSSVIIGPQGTTFINQYPFGGSAIGPRGTTFWYNTGIMPAYFSRPDSMRPYYAPRPCYRWGW